MRRSAIRLHLNPQPCYTRILAMLTLHYSMGTLELLDESSPAATLFSELPPAWRFDPRTKRHRAPAISYAETVRHLRARKIAYEDKARAYATLAVATVTASWPSVSTPDVDSSSSTNVAQLGQALTGLPNATPDANLTNLPTGTTIPRERISYLLPFEIISVHLLVVLIAAAYLARAKRHRKPEGGIA